MKSTITHQASTKSPSLSIGNESGNIFLELPRGGFVVVALGPNNKHNYLGQLHVEGLDILISNDVRPFHGKVTLDTSV